MSDNKWHTGLCQLKGSEPQCMLAFCFGCLGVAAIQAWNGKAKDGKAVKPFCCAVCLQCCGMASNRKAVRKEYQIQGSCLLDSLLYLFGCCCFLVAQEYREIDFQKSKRSSVPRVSGKLFFGSNATEAATPDPGQSPPHQTTPGRQEETKAEIKAKDFSEEDSPVAAEAVLLLPLCASKGKSSSNPNYLPPAAIKIDPMAPESERGVSQEVTVHSEPEPQPVEVAVVPLDGEDPNVYSNVVGMPPFSYLWRVDYASNCPPPTYLPLSILQQPKPQLSRDIWVGLARDVDGGFECVDQEALRRQSGVASYVIRQLGWALLKGLGAVSISLPIKIFEPRSSGERLMDRFSFAPVFLRQAAETKDHMTRFKLVLAFAVSSLYMGVKQDKPFNPLLGETVQGSFPDGAQIYCEHTAHNPPTDHFQIKADGYMVFGYYQLDGSFQGNSLLGSFRGPTTVCFPDGQMITYQQPKFRLGGLLAGKRTLNWETELTFEDVTHNRIAVIKLQTSEKEFNPHKKRLRKDEFLGKMYTPRDNRRDKIGEVLGNISGSWIESLHFESPNGSQETLWKLDTQLPQRHIPASNPLPSDWRYREDLIWLLRGNQEIAQAWKIKLETRQRDDRELRSAAAKHRKR